MYLHQILFLFVFQPIKPELVNVFIQKKVDLQTQLTKIYTKIIFRNLRSDYVRNYTYLLDPDVTNYYIVFTNNLGVQLYHNEQFVSMNGKSHPALVVYFQHPFKYLSNVELIVEEIHFGNIKQEHKKKKFGLKDLVSYTSNIYYYSMYESLKFNVTYLMNSAYHVNISPLKESNQTADYFFENVKPFAEDMLYIEFHSKHPFYHVLDMQRTIDISHYGQIVITENICLKNTGAAVYGPFKKSREKWFYTHLPASAKNVVMYDDIGVLYFYGTIDFVEYKTLQFKPRFQLQGGWQTTYTIKYMVPLHEYMTQIDKDSFELKMRVIDHVLNDIIVDKFETRVILPEAAKDVHDSISPIFHKLPLESAITHLSSYARHIIVFAGRNVIQDQISDFTIKYVYDLKNLLRTPLKLSLFCFAVLVSTIFFRRMSAIFTINT